MPDEAIFELGRDGAQCFQYRRLGGDHMLVGVSNQPNHHGYGFVSGRARLIHKNKPHQMVSPEGAAKECFGVAVSTHHLAHSRRLGYGKYNNALSTDAPPAAHEA